jgi:1-acyl-sn-glycerol-3-phosphate acyltransferase
MKRWLPAPLIGVLTFVGMMVVLMLFTVPLMLPAAILKLLLPLPALRRLFDIWLHGCANTVWLSGNRLVFSTLHGPRRNASLEGALDPAKSWLIMSNHQSWADILILFDVFRGRTTFPRFFMKQQLIWIPFVGFLCWALDMPFMKRHSPEAIAKNPRLRSEDLETTRHFCEKFVGRPITVVNFLEGTRYTPAKAAAKGSPYRHLLRPKSAGFSFTLNAMGEQFAGLLDVTLVYQPTHDGRSLLWSFLCGEQNAADVLVTVRPLPAELLGGDYQDDEGFRLRFQDWVNGLWAGKDALIEARLSSRIPSQERGPG